MRDVLQEGFVSPRWEEWYAKRMPNVSDVTHAASLLLTQGAVERPPLPIAPVELLQDKESLRVRAKAMRDILAANAADAQTRYLARGSTGGGSLSRLLAMQKDQQEVTKAGLLNTGSAWLGDIVGRMLEGGTISTRLSTYSPEAVVDGVGNVIVDYTGMKPAPFVSGRVGSLLRDTHPVSNAVHARVVMHDYIDPTTGERFSTTQQQAAASVGLKLMQDLGAVRAGDARGRTFSLQRTSELVPRVAELITRLEASGTGTIRHSAEGSLRFWPHTWLMGAFGKILPPERVREMQLHGLCLMEDADTPSVAALEATGFLEEVANGVPEDTMRVVVIDPTDKHNQADAFALVRATGLLRHDTYHPLVLTKTTDEDLLTYGLATALQSEVDTFLRALDAYDDVQALDPYKYIDHNYAKDVEKYPLGILPEDVQIVEHLARVLPKYLKGRQGLHGINIGRGPYSYLDQVLEPYLGSVELADPAESAQAIMQLAKDHALPPGYDVAPKFEKLLVAVGGKMYVDSNDRILEKAIITGRGIRDMPAGQYDIVFESFVSCSRSLYKTSFWADIRAKRQALRDEDSMMVSLHMVGSDGWGYAGKFPSAKMSLDEIRQGYLDANMNVEEFIPVSSDDKLHEGYHGMVIVVAKPRKK